MFRHINLSLCLLFVSFPVLAGVSTTTLSCPDPRNEGKEAELISLLAKDVATRKSLHELQIKTVNKFHIFRDKPPHDEPLSGTHYYFCDRKDGFILLMKEDEMLFTGTLINEVTGQITPGGETVIFSIDRRAYFTTEQPNGMDGSIWKIYAVNGKISWDGINYIPKNGDWNYADAYLEDAQWKNNGEFMAIARCTKNLDISWKVTLKKNDGIWGWHPKKKCVASKKKS